jgi:glucose/arabinose dehydrogenase
MQVAIVVRCAAAVLAVCCASSAFAQSARDDYQRLCVGCHGAVFSSPAGTSIASRTAVELSATIRNGVAARGMPAFGALLSNDRIDALAGLLMSQAAATPRVGQRVEAETLDEVRSSGYVVMRAAESRPTYVGYFGERSALCYSNVDLTGVRSIELNYANGSDAPGRFAVLIGDGTTKAQRNLGEQTTRSTGGWETFEPRRIGLAQSVSGRHELCFYGVSGDGIFNLDSFTLSGEPGTHDGLTLELGEATPPTLSAAGYRFALEKVGDAPSELWAMAFLPDGSLIVTQKNGQLLLFKDGKQIGRVEGVPKVWNGSQGGLLDVKPHPDYANNGWIYLTFSDPGAENGTAMTRVVRGKLDGLRWVQQQDIFRAALKFYTQDYAHFGSRIAFADGYIYFSVGERQQPELAQSLAHPFGKIHRLHDDGRIPKDNPFVGREDALPSIWSYGHRNPQGMTAHPRTREIWSAEHGPAGGDEINFVRKAANYGWPLVSHGTHYDGTPVSDSPYRDGVEPPIHHFTPSIGISQIAFYEGDAFPQWRGHVLVASLGRQELHLVQIRDRQFVNAHLLLKGFGRIRDVTVGPDGHPYVLLNQFSAGIYRLRPIERLQAS